MGRNNSFHTPDSETDTSLFFSTQIEREKSDLTVQLMSLSDRLEETEGSSEAYVS